jgi:hypothetical protein
VSQARQRAASSPGSNHPVARSLFAWRPHAGRGRGLEDAALGCPSEHPAEVGEQPVRADRGAAVHDAVEELDHVAPGDAGDRPVHPAGGGQLAGEGLLDLAPGAPALAALVAGDELGEHGAHAVAVDRVPAGACPGRGPAFLCVGDSLAGQVARVGEADSRPAAEGDPLEVAAHPGHHHPGLGAGGGDAQPKRRQESVEVFDPPGLGWAHLGDGELGQLGGGHRISCSVTCSGRGNAG